MITPKNIIDTCAKPKILVVLFENGSMPVHRIPRYGIGVGTAYRGVRELALAGLVHLYHCGNTLCVELTEKGREIAKLLHQAYKLHQELIEQIVEDVLRPQEIIAEIG